LLLPYNLISTVNFPTRCYKNSATATDNICIDINSKNDYTLCPIINALSDHDAQLLILNKITVRPHAQYNTLIRTLDKESLNDFLNKLSYERWDTTFSSEYINIMFNAILDNYLNFFTPVFPKK